MNSQTIISGLNISSQIPLDTKSYVLLLNDLINLGSNNVKAYYYYEGLNVYCNENKLDYQWREYQTENEPGGLILNGFVYPSGTISNGVNYSNRRFNFFLKEGEAVNQNNIIPVFYTNFSLTGSQSVSQAFNASPQLIVDETHTLAVVNSYRVSNGNSITLHTDYYFLRIGKGVYGNGSNVELNDSDFLYYRSEEPDVILTSGPSVIYTIVVPDNQADTFTIVNEENQEFEVVDGIDTFFIIKNQSDTNSSTNRTFRFVGPSGVYGSGPDNSLPNHFLELNGNTNTPQQVENNRIIEGVVTRDQGLDFISTFFNFF